MVIVDSSHKIVVTGIGKTGKTVLLERYIEKHFIPRYILTVVANFYMKIVQQGEKKLFLKFWDIPGLEAIGSTRQALYWYASGFLLCFDLSNPVTLTDLYEVLAEEILPILEQKKANNLATVLVGCKADLEQIVTINDIKSFQQHLSSQLGFEVPYFATSAKTGENVEAVFEKLVDLLVKNE